MAFDFYFAGSTRPEYRELITKLNANVLKSYVNDQNEFKLWFQYKRDGWKGKLLIDNGAFTIYRKGGTLDIDEYIKWLNKYDEYIDYAVALDDIPGKWLEGHTAQQVKESVQKTWDNYLYMRKHCKSPQKLLPVFHMGENFDYLKKYLELDDLEYMCISARKDITNKQREDWYEKCFYIISHSQHKNIKVHCLGSATLSNAEKFPFTSMDATSWIMSGANGSIQTDYGVMYVGDHCHTLRQTLPEKAVNDLEQYCSQFGMTLDEVGDDYRARICFNIHYLFDKSKSTSYNNIGFRKRRLF